MLNIGPQELIVILIIALLVVGPQRLPELSRQIGKGLREFRKIQDDVKDMVKLDLDDPGPAPAGSPTVPGVHRTPGSEHELPEDTPSSAPTTNGEAVRPPDPAADPAE
jgi:TatA/E family protein of Tat protein translocase